MDRLITAQELTNLDEAALFSLLDEFNRVIALSQRGSPQRRNALASYENIQRELNRRLSRPRPPIAPP